MAFPLLKNFFGDSKSPDKIPNYADMKLIGSSSGDSLIMDQEQIVSILNETEKNHALLAVEINENKKMASSMILEVNSRKKYLVVDEFCPNPINQSIRLGDKLDINCNYAGSSLHFLSEVLNSSEKNGNPYYKIAYPDIVEYSQRRQAHRVPVSISENMKVTFTTENGSTVNGLLRNLSLGGFCARLNPPLIERFQPNDFIPKCIIQMPDKNIIVCTTEVRRMFISASSGIPMIGCRFADISKSDGRVLQQNITRLERDLMKQIKRAD